ncbi:peptide/nickel transport system permease protein [Desulfitobacterium sp. LBE]|uniref:ABC transporter permease n=1 Tax=Desulfitobacterium sp. LBE TaxID=884086 RepID=UPI00119AD16C|nr:ABC transporter permease [Desulfitobacterium sp. LBE]TWH58126.1 peptide/nickel transport system permease protein [Desulfitobacterium sp. LBE]
MGKYILQRLLQVIPVLFIISFILYALVYVAGDPIVQLLGDEATPEQVASLRDALGLNQPFYVQYGIFLKNALTGQFGISYRYNIPAFDLVMQRLPATIQLGFFAMLFSVGIAIPLGILSALKQNSLSDVLITGASVLGKAMPSFWQGIMLILAFAVIIPIFPVSGRGSPAHLVLPMITLGWNSAAEMTRLVRSNMLEVLQQDYVRTAKSKGLPGYIVVFRHAFRNCLIPVVTIMSMQVAHLVGGSMIAETVFAWPGMGQLLVQAVNLRDMAVVQACVMISATAIVVMNLVADILYRAVDPRIKFH